MSEIKSKKVSIVMGSQSDFKTMIFCEKVLKKLDIKFYYNICNKISVRDINNIYTIIYIKWTRIINTNKNLKLINIINPKKKIYTYKEINIFFYNFINNSKDNISKYTKIIFILNIIVSNLI